MEDFYKLEEGILRQHNLLNKENNPIKKADCQRKSIAHLLKASCKFLSNENICELVNNELQTYSNEVRKVQNKLYDDELKQILSKSKHGFSNNFKSNLNSIDPKQFVTSLPCTNIKSYCPESENIASDEFTAFKEFFKIKKKPMIASDSSKNIFQRNNFIETQQNNFNLYQRNNNIESNANKERQKTTNDEPSKGGVLNCFKSAREELEIQNLQKYGNSGTESGLAQRRLPSKSGSRRNLGGKFIPPLKSNSENNDDLNEKPQEVDERLKSIEPKMIELIKSEIMDCGTSLHWDDIVGLAFAKNAIQEAVVWPMLRPDIFTGLRKPPKGILLFGPPGTGKTLIGKCVAAQSKSTFFSISASSLTSKWIGDGEKMVRALFAVARVHQPSVIFIDEVDSLLSQRSETEHESSRRIKTEFLVQLDGATTDSEEKLLVIGATNRPQELDEAARRRFVKRLYIPLPEYEARLQLIKKLISNENHRIQDNDFEEIANLSDGYSGADIKNLCSEASLGPIRSIDFNLIEHIQASDVRPLLMEDFKKALTRVKSSVAPKDLDQYVLWDNVYGSGF